VILPIVRMTVTTNVDYGEYNVKRLLRSVMYIMPVRQQRKRSTVRCKPIPMARICTP